MTLSFVVRVDSRLKQTWRGGDRYALERRGLNLSRSKTEYMCVNAKKDHGTVQLQGAKVVKVDEFKYLGSAI